MYYFQQDSIYAYAHNDTIQLYRDRFNIAQQFYVDQEETVYTCLTELGILKITKDGEHELFESRYYQGKIVMEPEGFSLATNSSFHALDPEKRDSLGRLMTSRGTSGPVQFLRGNEWIQTEEINTVSKLGGFKAQNCLTWGRTGICYMNLETFISLINTRGCLAKTI
ncbi:MAG: hypothetical protein H6560_20730 [Lewinellaceae bacterium]|nr:hypothetical protein [Lewinellaceae bacterium]